MPTIAQWLRTPAPVLASPDAANPPQLLPQWKIEGFDFRPVVPPPREWNKAKPWPFPASSLVRQPRNQSVV